MIDYIPENFLPWVELEKFYRPGMTFHELGDAVCAAFGFEHGPGGYTLLVLESAQYREITVAQLQYGVFLAKMQSNCHVQTPGGDVQRCTGSGESRL